MTRCSPGHPRAGGPRASLPSHNRWDVRPWAGADGARRWTCEEFGTGRGALGGVLRRADRGSGVVRAGTVHAWVGHDVFLTVGFSDRCRWGRQSARRQPPRSRIRGRDGARPRRCRARQSPQSAGRPRSAVRWLHADVTQFEPDRTWDLWHDRAVFHFLVDEDQRDDYRAVLRRAVAPEGLLVVAVFGHEAPARCAGLPVAHHDVASLTAAFAADFEPIVVSRLDPARSGRGTSGPTLLASSSANAPPRKRT